MKQFVVNNNNNNIIIIIIIIKTPAKWSTYQMLSLINLFVVIVLRVNLLSLIQVTTGLAPISYKRALLSTLLHALV
jgi:hypothetical protein